MTKTIEAKAVPELAISPEKLCFIIVKAHEFDAKDIVTDPDDSSNAADDACWKTTPTIRLSPNSSASSMP